MCSLFKLPAFNPMPVIVSLIKPLNSCGLQFLHLLNGDSDAYFLVVAIIKLNSACEALRRVPSTENIV